MSFSCIALLLVVLSLLPRGNLHERRVLPRKAHRRNADIPADFWERRWPIVSGLVLWTARGVRFLRPFRHGQGQPSVIVRPRDWPPPQALALSCRREGLSVSDPSSVPKKAGPPKLVR